MRYTIAFCMASLAATPTLAEVPRVVTDIPPVHSLVAQVMGDLGSPELLLDRGADEHSFQLRPSQAAALNDAGLVFWIGPELTPWLERALEGVPQTVTSVALLDMTGTVTRNYADKPDGAGHDGHGAEEQGHEEHGHDEHGHEEHGHEEHGHESDKDTGHEGEAGHDGDAHEGHDHSGIDAHAWLMPANATTWVGVIAEQLSLADPENAAAYAANAAAAVANIAAADAAAKAALAPVAERPFIVYHDAFGYFAASYGLTIAGSVAEGDAAAPGAARVAALRDTVAAGGAVCVFPEVQHDPALLEQITEGSPVRTGNELDPVGSSHEPGPDMYGALITGMANTIAACLSGN
jgi:zinc transport system substrate-binding protein